MRRGEEEGKGRGDLLIIYIFGSKVASMFGS
jgi:hypothetical protein